MNKLIWRVALAVPIKKIFDYLPPAKAKFIAGIRVKVPFGSRQLIGITLSSNRSNLDASKLKTIICLLDDKPLLNKHCIDICKWASYYYKYPLGQALAKSLPLKLRQGGQAALIETTKVAYVTPLGLTIKTNDLTKAPKQAVLLEQLQSVSPQGIALKNINNSSLIKSLLHKKWLQVAIAETNIAETTLIPPAAAKEQIRVKHHSLNPQQQQAFSQIVGSLNNFSCHLLEGITGSGKTEVYLHLIKQVLNAGKQVLVLVPEIGLTPQMFSRCCERFSPKVGLYHSQLSPKANLHTWLRAYTGEDFVIIGTRSAVFMPMANLGLIIIDEEHDISFKDQQDYYYSAKDIAIKKAKLLNISIVLGSATPTLESLHNVNTNKYNHLVLNQRATKINLPKYHLINTLNYKTINGFTQQSIKLITSHLEAGNQVLIFLNRRGFATLIMCSQCNWQAKCINCDVNLVWHLHTKKLSCHYCNYTTPLISNCGSCHASSLKQIGIGVEKVEHYLRDKFNPYPVLRIDSETASSKVKLDKILAQIHQEKPMLLIGTQMLAKGHHFPKVNLVVIPQADSGLFSPDFRAEERMYQLITQAAGRAGRFTQGEVIIQTNNTNNPKLKLLLSAGYPAYAKQALSEREQTNFTPFSYLAMIKCISKTAAQSRQSLTSLKNIGQKHISQLSLNNTFLRGPVSSHISKKEGYYHANLLVQSKSRKNLHLVVDQLIIYTQTAKYTHTVRFIIDIDPQDVL